MIRLAVRRVHPAEEQNLREWLIEVNGARRDEALGQEPELERLLDLHPPVRPEA